MPKVELHIGALAVHVRTARLVAAALGRRIGLDPAAIDEVKLAVGEACSRAVTVHHETGAREPIVVRFQDDDAVLEVAVLDCGPGGEQLPTFSDSDQEYQLSPALGLAVIAGLVDDVTIGDRSAAGGTVVTMRWAVAVS